MKYLLPILIILFLSCVDYEKVNIEITDQSGETVKFKNANIYVFEAAFNWRADHIEIYDTKGDHTYTYKIYKRKIKKLVITTGGTK